MFSRGWFGRVRARFGLVTRAHHIRKYLLGRHEDRHSVVLPAGKLTHMQELNGEDTVEFDYRWGEDAELFRYDRILWQDGNADWHERVVAESVLGERGIFHIFAENGASETLRTTSRNWTS